MSVLIIGGVGEPVNRYTAIGAGAFAEGRNNGAKDFVPSPHFRVLKLGILGILCIPHAPREVRRLQLFPKTRQRHAERRVKSREITDPLEWSLGTGEVTQPHAEREEGNPEKMATRRNGLSEQAKSPNLTRSVRSTFKRSESSKLRRGVAASVRQGPKTPPPGLLPEAARGSQGWAALPGPARIAVVFPLPPTDARPHARAEPHP